MISMLDPKTLTVFVTGATALVTGATAGFGAALCRRFVEAGGKVIATGRRKDLLEELKNELGEHCHVLDWTSPTTRRSSPPSRIPGGFEDPNVWMANAGRRWASSPRSRRR